MWQLVVLMGIIALISAVSMIQEHKKPKRPIPPTNSSRIAPDGPRRDSYAKEVSKAGGNHYTLQPGSPPDPSD